MAKKDRKRQRDDYDEKREERILKSWEVVKKIRKPTPPPGHFHTPKKRAANRPKRRKNERQQLKDAARDYNSGRKPEDVE